MPKFTGAERDTGPIPEKKEYPEGVGEIEIFYSRNNPSPKGGTGYGFITLESGGRLFFHTNNARELKNALGGRDYDIVPGLKVAYEVRKGKKGNEAINVRPFYEYRYEPSNTDSLGSSSPCVIVTQTWGDRKTHSYYHNLVRQEGRVPPEWPEDIRTWAEEQLRHYRTAGEDAMKRGEEQRRWEESPVEKIQSGQLKLEDLPDCIDLPERWLEVAKSAVTELLSGWDNLLDENDRALLRFVDIPEKSREAATFLIAFYGAAYDDLQIAVEQDLHERVQDAFGKGGQVEMGRDEAHNLAIAGDFAEGLGEGRFRFRDIGLIIDHDDYMAFRFKRGDEALVAYDTHEEGHFEVRKADIPSLEFYSHKLKELFGALEELVDD